MSAPEEVLTPSADDSEEILLESLFELDDGPVVLLEEDELERTVAEIAEEEEFDMEALERELDAELAEELASGGLGLQAIFSMPRVYTAAALLTVGLLGLLLAVGWRYYALPVSKRPFHYLHELLRPSGGVGLSLGIVGTTLIVASLAYLVRKGLVARNRFGSLRRWMGFHVFAGLIGPLIIVFHAAMVPTSLMGMLAFFGMAIVVCSGFLGRYIYACFPRSFEGRELELEVIQKRLLVYRKKILELGVNPLLLRIDSTDPKAQRSTWLLPAMVRVIYGDRKSRQEYARLRQAVRESDGDSGVAEKMLLLVRRLRRERQWMERYHELRTLLGAWRFLHRWLAIVMLAAVVYHVAVNIEFGSWLPFGGGD